MQSFYDCNGAPSPRPFPEGRGGRRLIAAAMLLLASAAAPALAQFKEGDQGGPKLGATGVSRWQAGVIVTAVGGACHSIEGFVPLPSDWPEQTVKIESQEVSPGVKISYTTIEQSVRVMVVRIPLLQANEEAKALLTLEVRRHAQLPPEEKDSFQLPDPKKLDAAVHRYLGQSPKIETRDTRIRRAVKDVGINKEKAWDKVEAIYDWVRRSVKYKQGRGVKGASAAFRDGVGNHEDLTSLFIAACRIRGIPARTVWVDQFCYAEFYLVDAKGEGHWIPCQPAGANVFGEMPETKPILQKGDNFRPPKEGRGKPREQQRYLAEELKVKAVPGSGTPQVKFVRKPVS
jgi:hypothetical protein